MSTVINTEISTRYMTIKLILDPGMYPPVPGPSRATVFPGSTTEGGTSSNVKILTCNSDVDSLTAEVTISKATGWNDCSAYAVIYGLNIDDINAFSRYNPAFASEILQNWIEIYAGYTTDANGLPPFVYRGQIRMAGADLNNPSRGFTVISQMGLTNQNTISPTTAPQGTIKLSTLFSEIASKFTPPLIYKGTNVTGIADHPNYSGAINDQIKNACADYGFTCRVDGEYLLVAPVGQSFSSDVFVLNSQNGMLGYPVPEEFGISVRLRFNPTVQFGQRIKIESQLLIANNTWYINGMTSILQNRGNKWETRLILNNDKFNVD